MIEGLNSAVATAKKQFLKSDSLENLGDFHIIESLSNLLHSDTWGADQMDFYHAWMKKLDIAKTHFKVYLNNWKPAPEKLLLDEGCYRLSILLAIRYLSSLSASKDEFGQTMKTSNVVFKVLNRVDGVFGLKNELIKESIQNLLNRFQPIKRQASQLLEEKETIEKVLPITVLFSEGPIARAYLETINGMGLKVKKVIQLVSSLDLVSKKPVGKFLPSSMRVSYAASKQYKQMFFWSNQMKQKLSDDVKATQQAVQDAFGINQQILSAATQEQSLTRYSDCVEQLMITGLKDIVLLEKMQQEQSEFFLFTGGGIVPDSLLKIGNKKLIHVHPGYLPDVRGADCVLWSQLIYGRTSASAFFLAPGIDVGDVILPFWLPDLKLKVSKTTDLKFQYRLIYGFLDPWVRSFVLKQLIVLTDGFKQINSTPQNQHMGQTYHFMHEETKRVAVSQFQSKGLEN
ncbi:hypothetical protein [Marinicella rhabdoformis]|uniref:hypothetical protein n=1 Tax=Marinicella rhabdoformis TaxID=2580566 RepID=UPI0012AED5A9|nr:hypothetical protein [Marinicella rhabdoformis]